MLKLSYHTTTRRKETISLMSKSITQNMAYLRSLIKYAEKYGVSREYNKSRSYIHFWKHAAANVWGSLVFKIGAHLLKYRPDMIRPVF